MEIKFCGLLHGKVIFILQCFINSEKFRKYLLLSFLYAFNAATVKLEFIKTHKYIGKIYTHTKFKCESEVT